MKSEIRWDFRKVKQGKKLVKNGKLPQALISIAAWGFGPISSFLIFKARGPSPSAL